MSELRKDPVTDRWVIISTERDKRPSDFAPVPPSNAAGLCPFCYGFEHTTPPEIFAIRNANTSRNSSGWQVRVVPNKFPALGVEGELLREGVGMFDRMTGIGAHEVIIENPDHRLRLWDYSVVEVERILEAYLQRSNDLKKDSRLRHLLLFKNEGEQAGASLAHSHSQLIATPVVPKLVREKLEGMQRYFSYKERCVYCDEIREEQRFGERVVMENDHFLSFCPFASRFPFEVKIVPKRHRTDFAAIDSGEGHSLAEILRTTIRKLNESLSTPQYNWVVHTAPSKVSAHDSWEDYHWHIEIIPRLTKIAGFEWGTGFYINPTPPEAAAAYLREVAGCGTPGIV
jgi:UDPglucose--hexose-1-phosphate uridylyltransferase